MLHILKQVKTIQIQHMNLAMDTNGGFLKVKEGESLAQGVYNQNIYVNPSTGTIIVKLSANHKFTDESYLPSKWEVALSFYRRIAHEIAH